ncbi:MAG: hypothetical protein KKD18_00485 [Nanoarchaeota archaeon]|nr:hypothetical protein [Nanoarchaeota archaeon]
MIVLIRYESVVFLGVLIGYQFLFRKNQKVSSALALGGILLISISVIFILNGLLYGNPFLVGYNFDYQSQEVGFTQTNNLFVKALMYMLPYGFHPTVLATNFVRFIVLINPLLFVLFLVGLPSFLLRSDKEVVKKAVPLFILMVAMFVYYGSNATFYDGGGELIYSSYARYFSLIYLFMVFFAAFSLDKIKPTEKLFAVMLSFLLVLSFLFSFSIYQVSYLEGRQATAQKYYEIKQGILSLTSPRDVIFTYYWDKILWPDRLTATASILVRGGEVNGEVAKILDDGRKVFIFEDSVYFSYLDKQSFNLVPTTQKGFYEVVRNG